MGLKLGCGNVCQVHFTCGTCCILSPVYKLLLQPLYCWPPDSLLSCCVYFLSVDAGSQELMLISIAVMTSTEAFVVAHLKRSLRRNVLVLWIYVHAK